MARDIRLVQNAGFPAEAVTLDWLLTPHGQLDDTEPLATAVLVALGTDRRALETDVLPDPDDGDHRGWWGDLEADEIWDGWPIGSRLWLLERSKITGAGAREGSTVARVEQYVREALQPFIERRIVSRLFVNAERAGLDRIVVEVALYRGPNDSIALRYELLWDR